ncbi:PfkB family carbohydrate kinase [Longispora sp. NPDC051575]|uniref:carbohydrate kinase family protein n=1 Tax=Longispora sp. NPDC051575 TaxID=3154943 RepID=UPI0034293D83
MTVVVVGDLVTDVLASLGGPLTTGSDTAAAIRETGGGSAANTACWLGALTDTTLVAVVGDDAAGRARVSELTCGNAVRFASAAPTGTVIVLSTPDERSMVTDRGANALLTAADIDAALPGARHLHLSGYVLFDPRTAAAGRHALARARELGATTSVDAGSAGPLRLLGPDRFLDWVRGTDVLLANLDEAYTLVGTTPGPASEVQPRELAEFAARPGPDELAQRLAGYATHAVVKLGADGAVWAGPGVVRVPGEPVTAVDPTGAGDAFAAGLLAAWLAGGTPVEALAAGAALGARAVTVVGARPRA